MENKNQENKMDLNREEEREGKSANDGIEPPSGDDQDQRIGKRKRYHRHTKSQIQEMETFFKECPHPDDKQRTELGMRLSLEPLQVKFWFQNKRTQMKAQHKRHDSSTLKTENDKLCAETTWYKEALNNAVCPNCGGPAALGEMSFDEQRLRIDNMRLREEIDRISSIVAKYPTGGSCSLGHETGSSMAHNALGRDVFRASDLPRSVSGLVDAEKPIIIELAVAAMEELIYMAQSGDPLWISSNHCESLNEHEYVRVFSRRIGPGPRRLNFEASKGSAVVIMNHIRLVEILMDVNQWSSMFASIVSRARTLEVLSTGVAGNYNGAIQVMAAEFQVPSPMVQTRENNFVRYCKQHTDGTWAVVDVSLDHLRPSLTSRCRRKPSGCLIQELPNGYSKVTWVEHVEIDDRAYYNMYKPLVNSGVAFGAKRWLATLDRQCERLASSTAKLSAGEVGFISSAEGKRSLLKLAERMVASFCSGVGASTGHAWMMLSGYEANDVRVMTQKNKEDPGKPPGIVLNAATSFWLPLSRKRVFDFLRNEKSRSQWDILSNERQVQEMAHIATGRNPGNAVSLLHINSPNSSEGNNMLVLQESSTDLTGSYVIYAPVDTAAMNVVLNGGDPNYVAFLPSGFAILPDGPIDHMGEASEVGPGGCLVTVAFQVLVDSNPTSNISSDSVPTVASLVKYSVERIKAGVMGEGSSSKQN